MSRTKIAPHLIRSAETSAFEGRRFDALCRIIALSAYKIVRDALFREAAETAAEVWVEEAKEALSGLAHLIDEQLGPAGEELKTTLASKTEQIPRPDNQEVLQHTHDLSRLMASSWIEILRRSLLPGKLVALSEHLLPEAHVQRATELMLEATSSFVVNADQVFGIMGMLRQKIVVPGRPVPLLWDIVLVQQGSHEILAGSSKQIDLGNALDLVAIADQTAQDYQKALSEAAHVETSHAEKSKESSFNFNR